MTGPRRGRGRLDNGLDAALWAPLRDVDPRVGEHLLDVLRDAGIAAYLEPAADVAPYTRTVFLPSPPSDRLFVDRARRADAGSLVDQHGDEDPPARPAGRGAAGAASRRDLDEAAEWARIVAAYEAENGPLRPEAGQAPHPPERPAAVLPAAAEEPDPAEEHYVPPPPPPLPVPSPASLYSVLLVVVGALLVWAPGLIGLSSDVGLILGSTAIAGGVVMLVARMRERSVDDGDDGAVV